MDDSQVIAFRCPVELLDRLDELAAATNTSRTALIAEAVRLFSKEVLARDGFVVPPYKGKDILKSLNLEVEIDDSANKGKTGSKATAKTTDAPAPAKKPVSRKKSDKT